MVNGYWIVRVFGIACLGYNKVIGHYMFIGKGITNGSCTVWVFGIVSVFGI